ncbi:mannonate dehydratase [Roseobacter sinensis]|uniref:Mannonate dehydratase n=1 Tax=Roseobacter sinensis TaxID=2931391 RepID=A0ABT3B9P3_9RHOB|nr:mannonate dehydratase [Roseobacter sp. WL0113]MCV3270272.1 mannonate dehydratase [Roseobacter sp. WL0113]
MKQCWRWFGPQDTVALQDLHMVGVEGIVTALHHIAPGTAWPDAEIAKRQDMLAQAGFAWDVVESLPVSEAIKTQSPDAAAHIAAYKESLAALARRGVETICYNFMPILDWTRTTLRAPQPHGGTAMQFNLQDFSVFDLHILARQGAAEDYSEDQRTAAAAQFAGMSDAERKALQDNIVAGLPGANDTWTVEDVRAQLRSYARITPERLRQNLIDFLAEVVPLAERLGLRLCCHPDDPPFGLLGLPRVMSTTGDYATVLDAVASPSNGATLCTGSLGVRADFDAPEFVRRLGDRIHFAHLRNTKRLSADPERPDFFEAAHLEGDTDMVGTIRALMAEERRRMAEGRRDWQIPMRPDHGQELLNDRQAKSMPGYPLIGRMRGLAELRGIMAALG